MSAATDAAGFRFAVVRSCTNPALTERLLSGALDTLGKHGVGDDATRVIEVPGAFELPMMAAKLARGGHVDAIICVGALVRGETPHFDHLCAAVAQGIQWVAIQTGLPVTFGVLTCDTLDQARARAGGAKGNKGVEAAVAAIEMVHGFKRLDKE
ncbi:MAG: 6,7-dimethyl-8-ribityllumazine synthase [Acidobacteriota bacterium]